MGPDGVQQSLSQVAQVSPALHTPLPQAPAASTELAASIAAATSPPSGESAARGPSLAWIASIALASILLDVGASLAALVATFALHAATKQNQELAHSDRIVLATIPDPVAV